MIPALASDALLSRGDIPPMAIVRSIVANLNRRKQMPWDVAEPDEPRYDPREIYGIIPSDARKSYDVRDVIARLVDGSRLHEFKARYGETLVCGFARIMGMPVGLIANNGILFSESALKGAHFVELCAARGVRTWRGGSAPCGRRGCRSR